MDAVWLSVVDKNFYRQQLGDLRRPSPILGVAAAFYVVFAIAIVQLAGPTRAWCRFGVGCGRIRCRPSLAAYGTYDMTNLSTLKGWPVSLSIVDMI